MTTTPEPLVNFLDTETEPERIKGSVYRVGTVAYERGGTYVFGRSLRRMVRLSGPFDLIEEDVSVLGADEVLRRIVNLDSVNDGLYRLSTTNEQTDWETGTLDSYDYLLVPYKP